MQAFTLFWLSGIREVIWGSSMLEALEATGYFIPVGHFLDFWVSGVVDDYVWDGDLMRWLHPEPCSD